MEERSLNKNFTYTENNPCLMEKAGIYLLLVNLSLLVLQVPKALLVSIKIYDILGNKINTLVNQEKPVGTYELTLNASNLPSGVYFYRIQAGSFVETKKMILLK